MTSKLHYVICIKFISDLLLSNWIKDLNHFQNVFMSSWHSLEFLFKLYLMNLSVHPNILKHFFISCETISFSFLLLWNIRPNYVIPFDKNKISSISSSISEVIETHLTFSHWNPLLNVWHFQKVKKVIKCCGFAQYLKRNPSNITDIFIISQLSIAVIHFEFLVTASFSAKNAIFVSCFCLK